jgi:hydrogenase expression/formation protein HypD
MRKVFRVVPRAWRGIGEIAASGLSLHPEYGRFDAETRFGMGDGEVSEAPECISGQILQGARRPHECSEFAKRCTPESPLGAPMVSSEGACAAYYKYRRFEKPAESRRR